MDNESKSKDAGNMTANTSSSNDTTGEASLPLPSPAPTPSPLPPLHPSSLTATAAVTAVGTGTGTGTATSHRGFPESSIAAVAATTIGNTRHDADTIGASNTQNSIPATPLVALFHPPSSLVPSLSQHTVELESELESSLAVAGGTAATATATASAVTDNKDQIDVVVNDGRDEKKKEETQPPPPKHKRTISWGNATLLDDMNNIDQKDLIDVVTAKDQNEKQQQQQQQQHQQQRKQSPERERKSPAKKPHHNRKVSLGGILIDIPDVYNDHLKPAVLPERISTYFKENDEGDDEHEIQRIKTAAELVSSVEAALNSKSGAANNPSTNHHQRGESSASPINLYDLAKKHPIESEAEANILKAIERQDQEQLAENEQIEAVASLFSTGTDTLLANVPEGAEGIFQSTRSLSKISVASATTGVSTIKSTAETINDSSKEGSSAAGTRRPRSDSECNSTISNSNIDASSDGVGNFSSQNTAVTATSRSPHLQHNYDYRRHHHRRQKTMEERLYSLNEALDAENVSTRDALQYSSRHTGPPTVKQDHRAKQKNAPYPHHRNTTSLDMFNENLTLLFQDVGTNSRQEYVNEQELIPLNSNVPMSINDKDKDSMMEDVSFDGLSLSASGSAGGRSRSKKTNNLGESILEGEDIIYSKDSSLQNHHQHQPQEIDIEMGGNRPSSSNVDKKKRPCFLRFLNKIGVYVKLFLKTRRPSATKYLQNLLWIVVVAICIASIFYYAFRNPPIDYDFDLSQTQNLTTCSYIPGNVAVEITNASYSWWILLIFVRLPLTFTLARALEIFLIDFIILECRWIVSCVGPTLSLLIVQAKGWPAILFLWSACNIGLLYGQSRFVNHWGYWQDYVGLFNECNSSGSILSSGTNLRVQFVAMALSGVVAIKRLLIGFQQGRKTYLNYAEELSALMTKILLISEISNLAIQLELEEIDGDDLDDSSSDAEENLIRPYMRSGIYKHGSIAEINDAAQIMLDDEEDSGTNDESQQRIRTYTMDTSNTNTNPKNRLLITKKGKEIVTGLLSQSQKRRIERLLGDWEEPGNDKILTDHVTIGAILQFKKSLSQLDSAFPFSFAFGNTDTRDHCIESSQNIYLRLLDKSPETYFHFNTLGLVALQRDGALDQEKLKLLIKVFRPNRDGRLSLIDFVKSTDVVYKEMKLLRASVRNSQKIDKSFERVFNILFYTIIAFIILYVFRFDPVAIFLSLSSIVLAFSFMISAASSKYIEGLMFILYRRPYDIGDRIVIQPVDKATSIDGSTDWIVLDITLFTTTVIYVFTSEVATLSNGSIANSRVMNGARSLPAVLYINLKFSVDTSSEKLETFREALTLYMDARPREWVKLIRITNSHIQADLGYVEYLCVLQHVNNWQQLDSLFESRSQAKYFCHELSKQLDIRYVNPPLPVDLNIRKPSDEAAITQGLMNNEQPTTGIKSVARTMSIESEEIRDLIRNRRSDVMNNGHSNSKRN